ncbi:basic salivary proline-rich protein 4-like [Balaenoptera ricei]|uniref:basic salivary proline-rich protein 4-like n=1 Tax=Balaenoptera ricei TaxID=2746895 RepID=UPI0028BDAF2E|nr:basic salivary proline-rich protein 4-like [Balaenoptera ricei]
MRHDAMEERVPGSRTSPHRVEYHKAIAFGRGGKMSAGLSKIRVLLARPGRPRVPAHSGQGRADPGGARSRPIWTGQSEFRTVPSPGNAGRGLKGSRRPPIPQTLACVLGPDRRRLGHPVPGSPVASEPRTRRTLAHSPPEPGGGWERYFLASSLERGGPAPSHRPDVSSGGSEDLLEAKGRRVQREKPALGSLGGPPTSPWDLAPDAARKEGRCPHCPPWGLPSSNPAPFPELPTSGAPFTSGRPQPPSLCRCQLHLETSAFAIS